MQELVNYLVRSLQEEHVYQSKDIHHRESYILRLITLAHLTHKRIRPTELTSDRTLGSAPTVSANIRQLIQKELIYRKTDEFDQRSQYLIPTDKAIELFTVLSQLQRAEAKEG